MHENFIELISANRKLEADKVREMVDGSTVLGDMALTQGFIDQIGGMPEVKKYLDELIGEEAVVCW